MLLVLPINFMFTVNYGLGISFTAIGASLKRRWHTFILKKPLFIHIGRGRKHVMYTHMLKTSIHRKDGTSRKERYVWWQWWWSETKCSFTASGDDGWFNPSGKLHVFGHDGDSFGMYCTKHGVFKDSNQTFSMRVEFLNTHVEKIKK